MRAGDSGVSYGGHSVPFRHSGGKICLQTRQFAIDLGA